MTSLLPHTTWRVTRRCLGIGIIVVLVLLGWSRSGQTGFAQPVSEPNKAAPRIARTAIFSDDFEAYGDSSLWSLEHAFTVQSRLVANGSYAARLTQAGGAPMFGRKMFDRDHPRVYARLRFQVTSIGGEPVALLKVRSSPTETLIAIRIGPDGAISYETGATGIMATSSVAASRGTWHELQVHVDTVSEGKTVRIWLDGAELTTIRQDPWLGGSAIRGIDLGDNAAGHQADIAIDDVIVDDMFIPSTLKADPVSGTLVVRAVPPLPGIVFELEGQAFTSSDDGVARIAVERWSADLRRRIVVNDVARNDGSEATFVNWENWSQANTREVNVTFTISEPVTFSFVDSTGAAVDPAMIDSLVIKSNTGVILDIPGTRLADPTLVTALTFERTRAGFQRKPTVYVVDQVIIDGANVVNSSQQRATFDIDRQWQISLLFYGVKLRAHDAFFGSPLGTELVVEAVDGSQQRYALDADGAVVIPRVPRGEYLVSVLGAGYSPPRPIVVSRDQVVELEVISALDIAVVLGFVATSVLALVIVGRPFLVTVPYRLLRSLIAWPFRRQQMREAPR